jgi:cytochrome P450
MIRRTGVAEVAAPLPMILIGDLLGVEPEDRLMLQRWSDELIAATSITATPEAMQSGARAFYVSFRMRRRPRYRRTSSAACCASRWSSRRDSGSAHGSA